MPFLPPNQQRQSTEGTMIHWIKLNLWSEKRPVCRGKSLLNWCFCGLQRVLDHDSLSWNDQLGSVTFTTTELKKIVANFQVSVSLCIWWFNVLPPPLRWFVIKVVGMMRFWVVKDDFSESLCLWWFCLVDYCSWLHVSDSVVPLGAGHTVVQAYRSNLVHWWGNSIPRTHTDLTLCAL